MSKLFTIAYLAVGIITFGHAFSRYDCGPNPKSIPVWR